MERQKQMKPDRIYVQMLGKFSMTYQGEQVQLGKWLSAKMIHLLLLLICNRGEGVSREELIRRLYGSGPNDVQNSNSLRAMIFRLRRSIQESGLPEGEYISTKGGRYAWTNQLIETELDVECFQDLVKAAFEEVDPELRVSFLLEACRAYQGDFMPDMLSDEWIAKTNWRYRELYMRTLRELTRQLKGQKRYPELLEVCERVLQQYPAGEWQKMKMECFIALKRYREAVSYYECLEKESRQICGPLLSCGLKDLYLKAKNMMQYETVDMEQIQADLAPDPHQEGASACTYLEFVDIYRYLVQIFDRKEVPAQLLLLTLTNPDGQEAELSGALEAARSSLEHAICQTIRRSDLYTRYGNSQFLVLLTSSETLGGKTAEKRIRERYEAISRSPQMVLKCEQSEVKPAQ